MSKIDEILSDPEGQAHSMDVNLTVLTVLNKLEALQSFSAAILKNQIRILQYLKTRAIDEDEAAKKLASEIERLNEEITRNFFDTVAHITSNSGQSPDPEGQP